MNYYLSVGHPPYYAALITGAWGIGKTYLVKSILKTLLGDRSYSYISLYGLNSVDAIDSAMYQSLHPALSTKGVKIVGRASKALMKYARVDNLINIKDFVHPGNDRLFVFDDLERSPLEPDILLGYINEMVEHDGCKVLIIGNEEKLIGKQGYTETREKLIGRTLEVQPEINGAFDNFLAQLSSDIARETLNKNKETIVTIFLEATATNFRIMQQTIWDFERLINCLDQKHLNSQDGIKALTETFFAISFETKAGFLTKSDILGRPDSLLRAMMQGQQDQPELAIDVANKRFSEADLHDPILSSEFICELLFKGLIIPSLLRESLELSKYFIDVSTEPAWRTVWHGFDRSEAEFKDAVIEMERQFQARELLDIGIILHVVGMRVWLSKIGEFSLTRKLAFDQARDYISDLYTAGELTPAEPASIGRSGYEGYGGLGIHEQGSEDFLEFFSFMEDMQSKAAIDQYPVKARKLLEDMELNASVFLRKICSTYEHENIYAYTPLLSSIPPSEFVERVMKLDGAGQRTVIIALNLRYSHGMLQRDLKSETSWFFDVYNDFSSSLKSSRPIVRWNLSNALNHYLKPIAIQAEEEGKEKED
nr:P-loop NTPase fold protein [Pseudomonas folii]